MKGIGFLLGCAVVLSACGAKDDASSGDVDPQQDAETEVTIGSFSFTYLGNLEGPPPPPASATASFDLGEIRASRDFYFLLRNAGDNDITDISLSSSSDSFDVSPGSIASLASGEDVEFLPIIRVSAIHGIALDGYGTTDVMSMGTNTSTVAVAGTSAAADGTTEDVTLDVALTLEALLMDVELYCDGIAMDLSDPEGSSSSSLGGIGWLPNYRCPGGVMTLENIGNVDIELSYYQGDDLERTETLAAPTSDEAGDLITVADGSDEDNLYWILELAGNNTIGDADRLSMGDNGRAYMIVEAYAEEG